jgi:hypothetical protein
MAVYVLNVEGFLTAAVASISIMIVGSDHVPQGLPVYLVLLHQAYLCYLPLLPLLKKFINTLLLPLTKKCHYFQLLSRPKMASHLIVRNLKMTASRPLFVKTTRLLGIIVRPVCDGDEADGHNSTSTIGDAVPSYRFMAWLDGEPDLLAMEHYFSVMEMSQMLRIWLTRKTTIYNSNLANVTP